MKHFFIVVSLLAFAAPALAQTAEEPASRDDVILYLRTMHSHDLFRRTIEAQFQAMQQLLHDQVLKGKGSVPADFDSRVKKEMDDLSKNMPIDEIVQAMIPTYQKYFTHGDIEAMNTFYSSPVGQKVLQALPDVMREGMQAAMPIMSKYISDSKERMQKDMDSAPAKTNKGSAVQN
jgi:hypothetical protein